ncbi:MAG: hypothetical protein K2W86_14905 [Sphingomonas sp.]|uniref:hypothetical protein n=1 Tax=Sphingomonas sp. TaxID=28214 RepID=UPI0035A90E6C|nr:hypothetical protein [Sphingomonas sp.]
MTHPHDQVCVSPVRIDGDGTIKIFDRLYWSKDSAKLPGRTVKAIVSPSPYEEIALLSLRGAQLCNAQLLQDTGWADAEAARDAAWTVAKRSIREAAAEETGEQHGLIVRRRAQLLIELIDKRVDRLNVRQPVFAFGKLSHAFSYIHQLIRRAWGQSLKQPHHCEQQRAADLMIDGDLALAIFDHRHPLFERGLHGSSKSSVGDQQPSPTDKGAHRLCGDGE